MRCFVAFVAVLCLLELTASASAEKLGRIQAHHAALKQPTAAAPSVPSIPEEIPSVDVPHFTGVSEIPPELQFLFVAAWICLFGGLPLLVNRLEGKPPTRTHQYLSIVLWVTLFGGLYLFTNVILFQSGHFGDTIRPLTVIECIYVMSQAITTVGYGDITPAKPRGQIFVGLYVIGALCVISMFLSKIIARLATLAEEYEQQLLESEGVIKKGTSRDFDVSTAAGALSFISGKPKRPDAMPLVKALMTFGVLDIMWICFFHLYPGEGKTWMEATYMSVITLSTVGFGAFTPVTEAGMVFGSFMMLFGSAALVNVIGAFAELMLQRQKYEAFDTRVSEDALDSLEQKLNGKTKVTDVDFLKLGLISQGLVEEEELDKLSKAFMEFGPKGGVIDLHDVRALVHRQLAS